jgi:Phytanoyl-CoA dioxygenase (PhyH)
LEEGDMYQMRTDAEKSPLTRRLAEEGILAVPDIYSVADLAAINTAMDPIFRAKSQEQRSYVRPDEMLDAGIFDRVLSRRMKDLILSVVPDPVLYHFHAYEIAGNSTKSHIFSESLAGWHRDPDSEFFPGDPTHLSVFVYMSDVGEEDGPFQFSPHQPDSPLRSDSPVLSMTGPAGMSFLWQRSYYHRAAPNRGPRRRRLIKISVQPNCFPSLHLGNEFFSRVRREVPEGDVETDLLLGRYQGRPAPKLSARRQPDYFSLTPRNAINAPDDVLAEMRRTEAQAANQAVAYD